MAKALAFGSVIAISTAFLAGAGCSSSSTKDSGPPDPMHYAGAIATAFCDALKSCCDAGKFMYDATSCDAQLANNFQTLADVVKHGKVIYDPNAAVACAAAFKAREATCSDDGGKPQASMGYIDAITAACFPVFKGTVAPGAPCLDPAECAAATADIATQCQTDPAAKGAAAAVNVCFQVTLHVAPGGACNPSSGGGGGMMPTVFTTAQCETATGFCKPAMGTMGTGTCVAYGKIGDACGVQAGDTCDPASMYCDTMAMKCAAIPDVGGDCLASGGACATGSYCPMTNKCTVTLDEGAVCTSNGACSSGICEGLPFFGMPGDMGICGASQGGAFSVSPRTCGFGPLSSGKDKDGIQPPAKAKSVGIHFPRRWFAFPD